MCQGFGHDIILLLTLLLSFTFFRDYLLFMDLFGSFLNALWYRIYFKAEFILEIYLMAVKFFTKSGICF